MLSISIDTALCIKCGKCVKVCPVYIFAQQHSKSNVTLNNTKSCIECGHCVDVCPTESILHSSYPYTKVHPIKKEFLPSPDSLFEMLKYRRSNRAFNSKPIPKELLHKVIQAAHLAPTATNSQKLSYTLVTNEDILRQISDLTASQFESSLKKASKFYVKPLLKLFSPEMRNIIPYLKKVVERYKNGTDTILRDCKAVIFIHAPEKYTFAMQDSHLAYQNASLMASCLGIGNFYTGFVCSANERDKEKKLNKLLGINGKICSAIALSMVDFQFSKYSDRAEIDLNIID